jgi:DNA-binding Lrp family transcriptional regulator
MRAVSRRASTLPARRPHPGLDALDRKILHELQADARLSNRELAERIGLSPAPCWRRVRRLETSGAIARYAALLEPETVGLPVTAYVSISLDDHHPPTVERFDRLIRSLPEVLECYSMSGQTDYLLKVVARSMTDYEAFLTRHLLPAVRSANTSFVLKRKKLTTVLPLEPGPGGTGMPGRP